MNTILDPNATAQSLEGRFPAEAAQYEPCEQCGAPMDRQQRYCINCAARRPAADNPASRYFAAATRRTRVASARSASAKRPAEASAARGAVVICLALLPIAIAVGVLVGNSGSGTDDEALLAAVKAVRANAATGTTTASTTAGAGSGGADSQAAANASGRNSGNDSGSGKVQNQHEAATGGTDVVAQTDMGEVHQVAGVQATPEATQQGQEVVNDIAHSQGSDYIDSQQGLPDVIVVGGDAGDAPAAPTTPGD